LIVAAKSQSFSQTPGVVGTVVGGEVGSGVVVDLTFLVDDSTSASSLGVAVAAFCASNNFSIENGVVDCVGQPVNSVVALKHITTVSGKPKNNDSKVIKEVHY
jgi:hypothetical protein